MSGEKPPKQRREIGGYRGNRCRARQGAGSGRDEGAAVEEPEALELVARELAAQFPTGGREWAEELAITWLGCSAEDAERQCWAIRAAKTRLDSQQSRNKIGSGA